MQILEMLIQDKGDAQVILHQVQEASRFIRYFRTAIESSPLQVYCSPLIFSPTDSLTRKSFQSERPDWILNNPLVEEIWSLCLHTLESHGGWVESVAWSPNGNRLASASRDMIIISDHVTSRNPVNQWYVLVGETVCLFNLSSVHSKCDPLTNIRKNAPDYLNYIDPQFRHIRIWDPSTGQSLSALKGHSKLIRRIAWSHDGGRLASASYDKTIKIWDPATGECALTLRGHSDSVNSVAWSQDGSRIASTSRDHTAKIWDSATSRVISSLEGHTGSVIAIAWSQDGSQLASGSEDDTVRIWDTATGQSVSTLEGHTGPVISISWSQDGSRLVSASYDKTIRIWDPATSRIVSTFKGHTGGVNAIAWSHDGSQLASASDDTTVRIWDPATSRIVSTFKGHTGGVNAIVWSHDGSQLASASDDTTVIIWDLATSRIISTLKGHTGGVNAIAWSHDGSQLASASDDTTVIIWHPASGRIVLTLEGHATTVTAIAWSQDGSRLASASHDITIRIWDPANGQNVSTFHISSSHFLQFDKVYINHLHTSTGTLDIGSNGTVTPTPNDSISSPELYGYSLSADHSWVTCNGVNLLWLPVEYRPTHYSHFATSATNLAIGCSSGRIMFLMFAEKSPSLTFD